MRQLILTLLLFLPTACAPAQPEAPTSPLPQPAQGAEAPARSPLAAPVASPFYPVPIYIAPVQTPLPEKTDELLPQIFVPIVGLQPEATPTRIVIDFSRTSAGAVARTSSQVSQFMEPLIDRLEEAIITNEPPLSLREALRPQIAALSAPLSHAGEAHRIFLPLIISIDQRVLDARAAFDCSQAEVLDAQQCDALLIFYALTNGPTWKKRDGWLVNKNPCTWHGLGCPEPEYNKMKLLLLPDNGLAGRLPYEIHQLPLTFLRVPGNHLSGSIPPTIARMTDLEEIRLESNQLSGQVPVGIANLTRLRILWLSGDDESTLCTPEELRSFVEQHLRNGYTPPSGGYCP